jgi:hypothetical protein
VLVGCDANAEVDVRLRRDLVAALADRADDLPLGDSGAYGGRHDAELKQGHGVAVRRSHRHAANATGQDARKGDGAGRGRVDVGFELATDVDAPVLAACIGVVAEGIRAQDRPLDGPCPGMRGRSGEERRENDRGREHSSHAHLPCGGDLGLNLVPLRAPLQP